ncbi:MAG: acyl-CoA reductase [Myxococcota bacterium]
MRSEEVAARISALRDAGRALRRRPFAETLDALCGVLDAWSDARSPWREELCAALPDATGFTPATVREGLSRALAHWNGEALRRLVATELGPAPERARGFDCTAVLLAGSIPMPSLLSLLAPLVVRSPVFAKCASRDPVTAPLVARSIAAADAGLGACIHTARFRGGDADAVDALLRADCVVATGSDATVDDVAARVASGTRLVRHGHRLSLAAVGEAATRGEALAALAADLALDVALWDQLGCLSPVAVLVAGGPAGCDRVAEALAAALEAAEKRWPRGRVEPADAALFANEAALAELRGAGVFSGRDRAWTVVREADATPRPAPLHRFLRVLPVADEQGLLRAIDPWCAHLAAVAIAGFGTGRPALADALLRRGASRVCAPGELQAPPLDWRNDGHGVVASLVRRAEE